ncbi:MAG: glycosyltransferase family 4 protein [Acidimicrobiia bacterium]
MSHDVARVARAGGLPYVVTVWENATRHPSVLIPGLRHLAARVVASARLVHCVSQRSVDYVQALHPALEAPVIQVFPGVDVVRFASEPSLRPDHLYRFLFVGRLVPEKGVRELIGAFHRLAALRRHLELWIAGTGPLAQEVEHAARETAGVRFLGFVPRRQLPEILGACHTLVLPSQARRLGPLTLWEEQFGFVLVEAMATGLDVIASRSGSIPEVVGGVGALLQVDRLEEALVSAMRASAETADGWLERSEAARARAVKHFDARRNAERLLVDVEASLR